MSYKDGIPSGLTIMNRLKRYRRVRIDLAEAIDPLMTPFRNPKN